jgi:hypothetical protein
LESSSEGSNWAPLHEPSSEGSQADYRRRCKFDSSFDYDSDSIYAIIFRMVCTHCGSQSHHTGHSACANYCTLRKESGQPSSFKAAHPSIQRGTSTRIKSSSYQGPGVKELETIAHKGSIKTATALVHTLQARMRTSPTQPGYASHRAMLCYHLTRDPELENHSTFAFSSWLSQCT